jgi:glycosyltransferase involved in cell wall biosynthesis
MALVAVPREAAATRYRLYQFVEPLARRGIELRVRPFLDAPTFAGLYDRAALARTAAGAARGLIRVAAGILDRTPTDLIVVQREALLLGPPVVEWLSLRRYGCPLLLDLDDATYVRYVSPTYPLLGRLVKWPAKTDTLIRWAAVVTCGNDRIAAHVADAGTAPVVLPTVVDTDLFRPRTGGDGDPIVLGWVGSHSTFPYLVALAPVLRALAGEAKFRLRVVGSGQRDIRFDGVDVETVDWDLDREVDDFRSFDVGLYPVVEDEWSVGKSGLKAIQYMAVGIPYVAAPVGAAGSVGEPGVTHLCARTPEEWLAALRRLVDDADLRRRMGAAGRAHAVDHYSVDRMAGVLAGAIRQAAEVGRGGAGPTG